MNRSIVITRYAGALVKLVCEEGGGDAVCAEAESLIKLFGTVPDLRRMISASDDVVKASEKEKLMQTVLPGGLSSQMSRFFALLNRNGRMDLAPEILRVFTEVYRRSIGIRKAHLTTVTPPSEELLESLRKLVREKTGDDVLIEVEVDPELIGGFVFDIDDYLLDGSVKRQLELIREKFTEWNKRII